MEGANFDWLALTAGRTETIILSANIQDHYVCEMYLTITSYGIKPPPCGERKEEARDCVALDCPMTSVDSPLEPKNCEGRCQEPLNLLRIRTERILTIFEY